MVFPSATLCDRVKSGAGEYRVWSWSVRLTSNSSLKALFFSVAHNEGVR